MTRPTIIMVAPNGARKVKTDHSAVPVTIDETIAAEEAKLAEIDARRAAREAPGGSGKPPSEAETKKYTAIQELITRLRGERDRFKV